MDSVKMILVLSLISGAAGLGLAAMHEKTAPLIEENNRQFTLASINQVLPEAPKPDPCQKYNVGFDNAPDKETLCIDNTVVYRAKKGDQVMGIAVKAIGDKAYGGTMTVLVGLRLEDGMLTGIKVLQHAETPGLGSNMTKCTFKQQMVGQTPDSIKWTVAKDGGDVNQLSGATISSRSVLTAIKKAQDIWRKHRHEIPTLTPVEGGTCDGQ